MLYPRWQVRVLCGMGTVCLSLLFLVAVSSQAQGQDSPAPLVLAAEFQVVQEDTPKVLFVPVMESPEIDGEVEDSCWAQCTPVSLSSDMPRGLISRKARFRVCRDAANLYVAFECREPLMENIPTVKEPPSDVLQPENVQIFLAPADQLNDLYVLATDSNGGRYDWSLREGLAWSPGWKIAVQREAHGWTGEVAIPFESLGVGIDQEGKLWRMNLCRDVGATCEECSWNPTLGNRRNPAQWGGAFFGDQEAYEKREQRPRLKLHPSSWVIGGNDFAFRLLVRLRASPEDLAGTQLRVSVAPEGAVATEGVAGGFSETIPVKGQRGGLTLNAGTLPPGDFEVVVELLDKEGTVLTDGRLWLTKNMPPATPTPARAASAEAEPLPPPARLELIVPGVPSETPAAKKWPITTGVALPRGALFSPKHVRLLDPAGAEVPSQAVVRGRWPGDGSIRWLGLDFQADLVRSEPGRYVLEYGPAVQPMPVAGFKRDQKWKHLPFEPVENEWLVNTGPLLFSVDTKRFTGTGEAWVDVDGNGQYDWNEQIINATKRFRTRAIVAGAGPYIVDSDGWTYRFGADPKAGVVLEEWNELRLVFRGEGRLLRHRRLRAPGRRDRTRDRKAPAAREMGRCVMRLFAYAGRPFLRLQYTFYLNHSAANSILRDIGILEKLDVRNKYDAVFGLPKPFRKPIAETGPVSLLKPAADRFYVLSPGAESPVRMEGTTGARNWACAAAKGRGLAVCLRDMGHLYPKELELRPEGGVIIHLWPPHGSEKMRALRGTVDRRTVGGLGFAHSGNVFDLRVPAGFSHNLKDRNGLSDFDAIRDTHRSEPTGIALTCDLLYIFYAGDLNEEDISEIARLFQLRPHAFQDRKSLAASGVFPGMLPPHRARRAVALASRLLRAEGRSRQDGMFNYLDLHGKWLAGEKRWALRNHWVGTRADVPGMLWQLYLQTGEPELFLAAERNLGHVLAMDFCHDATAEQAASADPRRRNLAGGFGDNRTPVHWQSTCHVNDSHARIRAPLLSYYLTGNLQARDAVRLWGQAAATYGIPNHGEDGAVFLCNLWRLLELQYDAALHDRLGACADYLFVTPVNLAEETQWLTSLRYYARESNDPRVPAFLKTLTLTPEARASFSRLCLLRELHAATGDEAHRRAAESLIREYEKAADTFLNSSSLHDETVRWETLASYVFGAAEPVEEPKKEPASRPVEAPKPVPAPTEGNADGA